MTFKLENLSEFKTIFETALKQYTIGAMCLCQIWKDAILREGVRKSVFTRGEMMTVAICDSCDSWDSLNR
jgi:hypothetical protein